ncbi:MAG: DivIVA domain-containing protein [Verrucomicrobia bacterium]|nr:DivIVA domain-containing protein [Cytophagales bacterium]
MAFTASDIRNKFFKKVLAGGYDREEVANFLHTLSKEWEKVSDENKEYKIKLDLTEREVRKLKEIESSLYQTLKTAEETSNRMIEQASQSAEKRGKEVQDEADAILREARQKAQDFISEAEGKSRSILETTLVELQALEKDFHHLENQKDKLIGEMRGLVNNTLEGVNRVNNRLSKVSLDERINEIVVLLDRNHALPPASVDQIEKKAVPPTIKQIPEKSTGSFFDEIV